MIKNNRLIRDLRNIPEIFQSPLFYGSNNWSIFYRPLEVFSYLIDFHIWGLNPTGYHVVNTTLHILNSWLLYGIIWKLTTNGRAALIAALFFVIHPVNVESVSFISCRGNLLATFFLFLSFWLYLRSAKLSSLLSFIFALLSKEIAVVLPLLVLLYEAVYRKKGRKKLLLKNIFWKTFPYFLIVFSYFLLRLTLLRFESPTENILLTFSIPTRAMVFIKAIAVYIKWLLFPFPLHMDKLIYIPNSLLEPFNLLSLLLLLTLGWALIKFRRSPHILFFSFWFFLSLLPVSNIFPINALIAERWIYQPSLGWFALWGMLGSYLWEKKRTLISPFILLFVVYSFLTIQQNKVWRNEFTFYNHILKYTPGAARIHNNLAILHEREGRTEKAILHYYKAIKQNPNYEFSYNNLGVIFIERQQLDEAKLLFRKAIDINPKYASPFHNLGKVYLSQKKYDLAEIAFQKAIQLNPFMAGSQLELGKIYLRQKKVEKAKFHLIKASQSDRQKPEFYLDLGNMFLKMEVFDYAKKAWEKVLALDPNNEEARIKLKRLSLEK